MKPVGNWSHCFIWIIHTWFRRWEISTRILQFFWKVSRPTRITMVTSDVSYMKVNLYNWSGCVYLWKRFWFGRKMTYLPEYCVILSVITCYGLRMNETRCTPKSKAPNMTPKRKLYHTYGRFSMTTRYPPVYYKHNNSEPCIYDISPVSVV